MFSIWNDEVARKERQKVWNNNFRKIGEDVYTFLLIL